MPARVVLLTLLVAGVLCAMPGCRPAEEAPVDAGRPVAAPGPAQPAVPESQRGPQRPALDEIPDQPVSGSLEGYTFAMRSARMVKARDEDLFLLQISNGVPSDPEDPASPIYKAQGIDVQVTMAEGETGHILWPPDDWGAPSPAQATFWRGALEGLRTHMGRSAGELEFTEWQVSDQPTKGSLGTVRGRIFVRFEDEDNSEVAGTFEATYLAPREPEPEQSQWP
ncbi:MAG: hypothetical protein AB7Y46_01015 [Armatimonadota bacterium]